MSEWPPYADGFRVIPTMQGDYPGDFDLIDYPGEVWDLDATDPYPTTTPTEEES